MVQQLTPKERAFLATLRTPERMQAFLDTIGFNDDARISVVDVLRRRKGDCIESACLAAYVLRNTRFNPRLLDFTSVHDDDEILEYTTDPELIHEKYADFVDAVIDGGYGKNEASTIVDCTGDEIEILRQGLGVLEW